MTQAAKVALLVGAGDAIGAAVARRFAHGGFAVCIARREAVKSQALIEEIRSEGGEARAYSTDARKEENVKALLPRSRGTWDRSRCVSSMPALT